MAKTHKPVIPAIKYQPPAIHPDLTIRSSSISVWTPAISAEEYVSLDIYSSVTANEACAFVTDRKKFEFLFGYDQELLFNIIKFNKRYKCLEK